MFHVPCKSHVPLRPAAGTHDWGKAFSVQTLRLGEVHDVQQHLQGVRRSFDVNTTIADVQESPPARVRIPTARPYLPVAGRPGCLANCRATDDSYECASRYETTLLYCCLHQATPAKRKPFATVQRSINQAALEHRKCEGATERDMWSRIAVSQIYAPPVYIEVPAGCW